MLLAELVVVGALGIGIGGAWSGAAITWFFW